MTQRKFFPMKEVGTKWIQLTKEAMTISACNELLRGCDGVHRLSEA